MALTNNKIYGIRLTGGTIYSGATELSTLFPTGSGEVNSGVNVGAGNGIFLDKSGLNLRFKTVIAGSNITITNNTNDITISSTASSGTSSACGVYYVSPDCYGALKARTRFTDLGISQATIDATYPGVTGLTQDTYCDFAAWQYAINLACSTGLPLTCSGTYYVDSGLTIPRVFRALTINGNQGRILADNNNAYTILGRIQPTGQTQALNEMVASKIVIRDLEFGNANVVNTTQIGLRTGPCYMSTIDGCKFDSIGKGLWVEFGLNTTIQQCQTTSVRSGITLDMGNWNGADNSNSQSNNSTIKNCRTYMTDGDYGYGIYASSGVHMLNNIVEGTRCINGIDYDTKGSNNVYNFSIKNLHFECNPGSLGATLGSQNSCIRIKQNAGNVDISHVYGQYESILLDVKSSIASGNIRLSDVYYWVGASAGTTNYWFRSRSAANQWLFTFCDNLGTNVNDYRRRFISGETGYSAYYSGDGVGIPATPAVLGGTSSGNSNYYVVIPLPR
jgi:hypothetical protein